MNLDDYEEYETVDQELELVEPELMEIEGSEHLLYALIVADVLLVILIALGIIVIVKM